MNTEYDAGYNLKPILMVMDEIINGFYQQNPWGYSLPNYLSAIHNAHPNYAGFLSDKNTMTVDMMDDIFARMDPVKKVEYDKGYIENLYLEYMNANEIRIQHLEEFKEILSKKIVLLIAPGKSSVVEQDKIKQYASRSDVISISVNFLYPYYSPDYIFISNNIRFRELPKEEKHKCIITSNIPDNLAYLQIRYRDLLNDDEFVGDNS